MRLGSHAARHETFVRTGGGEGGSVCLSVCVCVSLYLCVCACVCVQSPNHPITHTHTLTHTLCLSSSLFLPHLQSIVLIQWISKLTQNREQCVQDVNSTREEEERVVGWECCVDSYVAAASSNCEARHQETIIHDEAANLQEKKKRKREKGKKKIEMWGTGHQQPAHASFNQQK